jgi:transcriptional regulator with GAF, ATPase, and Fis domain
LAEHEKRHIERALKATNGVIFGEHGAAKLLDINPYTLRSRIQKYGLHRPE